MSDLLIIDYEKEIKNYNDQLVTKLRDFGEHHLKFWIPEENNVLSLLNLFFSVVQSYKKNFEIKINKNRLSKTEIQRLKNYLEEISNYKIIIDKNKLIIQIQNIKKDILEKILNNYFDNSKIKKTIFTKRDIIFDKKKNQISIAELNKFYFKKNHQYQYRIDEKKFNKKIFDYKTNVDKFHFGIKLNSEIIKEAYFSSTYNGKEIFFLDIFCNLIKDLPLQEAYEHGVLKLEYFLRNDKINKKIKGIISPFIIKNLFEFCNKIIQNIWKDHIVRNNLRNKVNFFDTKLSKKWSKLNKHHKVKILQYEINKFLDSNDLSKSITIEKIEKDKFISLTFGNYLYINKPNLLLNLEKHIKYAIDDRIELFYTEIIDSNKLRLKNSPQKINT